MILDWYKVCPAEGRETAEWSSDRHLSDVCSVAFLFLSLEEGVSNATFPEMRLMNVRGGAGKSGLMAAHNKS